MPLHTFDVHYFLIDSANTPRKATLLAENETHALDLFQQQHPLGSMLSVEQID